MKVLSPSTVNRVIHYIHNAAVVADEIILVGGRVLVAVTDIAANTEGMYYFIADEIEHTKAAVAIVAGDTAYWDNGNSVFTNVVGTNVKCGVFRKDAAIGDAEANLRLDNTVTL